QQAGQRRQRDEGAARRRQARADRQRAEFSARPGGGRELRLLDDRGRDDRRGDGDRQVVVLDGKARVASLPSARSEGYAAVMMLVRTVLVSLCVILGVLAVGVATAQADKRLMCRMKGT